MKRNVWLYLLLLVVSLAGETRAQDIYKTILADAETTMNDESNNIVVRKIATFKYDDLRYIYSKAVEGENEVTYKFLDDQAYYLSLFINSFISDVLLNESLSKSDKKKKINLYIDATGSNPLFNDTDKGLVNAYVNDSKNQYTPFCLDTDWVKAFAAVKSQE